VDCQPRAGRLFAGSCAADEHLPAAVPVAQVHALAADVAANPYAGAELRETARTVLSGSSSTEAIGDLVRRAAEGEAGSRIATTAAPLLHAGENRAGLLSFRYLVPFAALVPLVFGLVALIDRRGGGYAAKVTQAKFTKGILQ